MGREGQPREGAAVSKIAGTIIPRNVQNTDHLNPRLTLTIKKQVVADGKKAPLRSQLRTQGAEPWVFGESPTLRFDAIHPPRRGGRVARSEIVHDLFQIAGGIARKAQPRQPQKPADEPLRSRAKTSSASSNSPRSAWARPCLISRTNSACRIVRTAASFSIHRARAKRSSGGNFPASILSYSTVVAGSLAAVGVVGKARDFHAPLR